MICSYVINLIVNQYWLRMTILGKEKDIEINTILNK